MDKPHDMPSRLLPWIALALSVGSLVWQAGKNAATLDAATQANASSLERHEQQEREINLLDDRVDYLCNARKRDDRESGRAPENGC